MMYVVYELGFLGSQVFLGILDAMVALLLVIYPHTFSSEAFFLISWVHLSTADTALLAAFLGLCSVFLFANVLVDYLFRPKRVRRPAITITN